MKLEYFVVAENASIDQYSNQVSVFNIREELRVGVFPAIVPIIAISGWILNDDELNTDYQIIHKVKNTNGEEKDFPQNFKSPSNRHRALMRIDGIPLEKEGTLEIEVIMNGKHEASNTVDIVHDETIK